MIVRTKKKSMLAVFFSLCLLLVGLFPTGAMAVDYGVTVNGIGVTDANAADVLGDGTVSYDSGSNTLSLQGANLNKIENNTGRAMTISTTGDNTITLDTGTYTYGVNLIHSNAPLTFDGSDSLTLDGTNRNLSVNFINATGDVVVDGITMTRKSSNGAGICSDANITIKNGALIQGDVQNMLYTDSGKLTVTGSEISMPLEGTDVAGWLGIDVNEMEIIGSTLNIAAPCGIRGASSITIKDSPQINVTSTIRTSNRYPAIWSNGSINMENSSVTAVSTNYMAIYSDGDITITGGNISAKSNDAYHGILARGTLTINGPITVETGTNGGSAYYEGDVDTVIYTSTQAGDTMYEVFAGDSEQSATELEGSPFGAHADVAGDINGASYFRIAEHTHVGGTADCSSPAICQDCGNAYGQKDATKHTNLVKTEAKAAPIWQRATRNTGAATAAGTTIATRPAPRQ